MATLKVLVRDTLLVRSVFLRVCVRAHVKTTRCVYAWVYVLSSWPVKGSLTSLIMGMNICRGLIIKSNWLAGSQHCGYFSYNYVVT